MEHTIETFYDTDDSYYWECDCGVAGSGSDYTIDAELHSDRHIDYNHGDTRIDKYPAK